MRNGTCAREGPKLGPHLEVLEVRIPWSYEISNTDKHEQCPLICVQRLSSDPRGTSRSKVVTYPGVVVAPLEEKIPQVQMRDSQLSESGLVDEITPGSGVREVHEVVDILDGVLGLKDAVDLSALSDREVKSTTHGIGPCSVTLVISKSGVEVSVL